MGWVLWGWWLCGVWGLCCGGVWALLGVGVGDSLVWGVGALCGACVASGGWGSGGMWCTVIAVRCTVIAAGE